MKKLLPVIWQLAIRWDCWFALLVCQLHAVEKRCILSEKGSCMCENQRVLWTGTRGEGLSHSPGAAHANPVCFLHCLNGLLKFPLFFSSRCFCRLNLTRWGSKSHNEAPWNQELDCGSGSIMLLSVTPMIFFFFFYPQSQCREGAEKARSGSRVHVLLQCDPPSQILAHPTPPPLVFIRMSVSGRAERGETRAESAREGKGKRPRCIPIRPAHWGRTGA